jgi:dTDP-4-dehydrorhamnose 3,5-epimerase-like enzyme
MPESFRDGEIKGVVVTKLSKFPDSRGWLAELFRHDNLAE